jgi:AcrR family transcriptional regulator
VEPGTDSPPAPPRRRADAERNERHIVEAAAEVIWHQPTATIADIATASGLGRATIYRHFPTREDLLRGIARHGMEQTAAALRASEPGQGTAVEALRRMIDAAVQPGYVCMIVLPQLPEPAISEAEKVEMLAPFLDALQRGIASGELRRDLDLGWVVRVSTAVYQLAMDELASGRATREQAVRLMADSLFEGVLARP